MVLLGDALAATLLDAALPCLRDIDPQRLRTIKAAFDRLGLLQREGVAVSMAEILIRHWAVFTQQEACA